MYFVNVRIFAKDFLKYLNVAVYWVTFIIRSFTFLQQIETHSQENWEVKLRLRPSVSMIHEIAPFPAGYSCDASHAAGFHSSRLSSTESAIWAKKNPILLWQNANYWLHSSWSEAQEWLKVWICHPSVHLGGIPAALCGSVIYSFPFFFLTILSQALEKKGQRLNLMCCMVCGEKKQRNAIICARVCHYAASSSKRLVESWLVERAFQVSMLKKREEFSIVRVQILQFSNYRFEKKSLRTHNLYTFWSHVHALNIQHCFIKYRWHLVSLVLILLAVKKEIAMFRSNITGGF